MWKEKQDAAVETDAEDCGCEPEHRTKKKRLKNPLQGALDKIAIRLRKNMDNGDDDIHESDPDEPEIPEDEEPDEKTDYHMLTREERNQLKAQRELKLLREGSPAFAECLVSCIQTPIAGGISIGCPNAPIYRLVTSYIVDAKYLFAAYEP